MIILLGAVSIIGYSEAVLNRVDADYQIAQRPPMFEHLRTILRSRPGTARRLCPPHAAPGRPSAGRG